MIRKFKLEDSEQIQAFVKPMVNVSFNWTPEFLQKELEQAQTWVLTDHDEILAFICLRDLSQAWDLTIVATKPSAQRKGHMENLMSYVIAQFAAERQLWLEVHQDNLAAQKFYQKMGFRHSGTRGGYYSDGSAALLYTFENFLLS